MNTSIDELELWLQKKDAEVSEIEEAMAQLFQELPVSEKDLHAFLNDKSHFEEEAWEKMEAKRMVMAKKYEKEKIQAPQKKRPVPQAHWIHVR